MGPDRSSLVDWTKDPPAGSRPIGHRNSGVMLSSKTVRFNDPAAYVTDVMYKVAQHPINKPRTNWAPSSMFDSTVERPEPLVGLDSTSDHSGCIRVGAKFGVGPNPSAYSPN